LVLVGGGNRVSLFLERPTVWIVEDARLDTRQGVSTTSLPHRGRRHPSRQLIWVLSQRVVRCKLIWETVILRWVHK